MASRVSKVIDMVDVEELEEVTQKTSVAIYRDCPLFHGDSNVEQVLRNVKPEYFTANVTPWTLVPHIIEFLSLENCGASAYEQLAMIIAIRKVFSGKSLESDELAEKTVQICTQTKLLALLKRLALFVNSSPQEN